MFQLALTTFLVPKYITLHFYQNRRQSEDTQKVKAEYRLSQKNNGLFTITKLLTRVIEETFNLSSP